MQPGIYIITGVMASGKSTVAELLARRMQRCVHLRGDVFRKMIASGRADMSEHPDACALQQLDLRYRITAGVARMYFDGGFSVVMQDNYYGDKLPYIVELLGGYPLCVVVLCPDKQTVALREAGREKRGYTGFSVESLYDAFMRETPRIGLWLDTTRLTPLQSVQEIEKRAWLEGRV